MITLSGTFRLAYLRDPGGGLGLRNDCQDLNFVTAHIVKDAKFIDNKSMLRASQTSKSLDSALTHLGRLMPRMNIHSIAHVASFALAQPAKVIDGFGGQNHLERRCGEMLARIAWKIRREQDHRQSQWTWFCSVTVALA